MAAMETERDLSPRDTMYSVVSSTNRVVSDDFSMPLRGSARTHAVLTPAAQSDERTFVLVAEPLYP